MAVQSGLDRRKFLKILVATGAATSSGMLVGVMDARATSSDTDEPLLPGDGIVGTIISANSDHVVVRTSTGDESVIAASSGAHMYSGAYGAVSSTSQFLVGDRVAVSGHREGAVLIATAIGSVFTPLDAIVESVTPDGAIAQTTVGQIELTGGRLPFSSDAAQPDVRNVSFGPGSILRGLGWQDPVTGDVYMLIRDSGL